MLLETVHYTSEFKKHIEWIIEELKKDSTKGGYLELEWFDESILIDLDMAREMKRVITTTK
ncbi:hypothetical protein [Enterococcus casseliflavus]|uniref:hypothetical protein n=1 Tax=Enterococcus casseliflavus TaxID=37734 RepID=UPI0022E6B786|nr:hypothetical protein [Enterococcus casseliflavus]